MWEFGGGGSILMAELEIVLEIIAYSLYYDS